MGNFLNLKNDDMNARMTCLNSKRVKKYMKLKPFLQLIDSVLPYG